MAYIPASKEEEEFLKNYDSSIYQKPSVAVDGAIFAWDRALKCMKVLLIRRGNFPYKDTYSIPGGFVEIDEDLDTAVVREIKEETDIEGVVFDQVRAFGQPDRDPRQRVITVLFAAMVQPEDVKPKAGDDAAEAEWFCITGCNTETVYENGRNVMTIGMTLTGSRTFTPKIKIDTDTNTVQILDKGGLAFDHAHEVIAAYRHILKRLS